MPELCLIHAGLASLKRCRARQRRQLTPAERQEIASRIQEIGDAGLTEVEKQILDRELADYERDLDAGSAWGEVEARIRGSAGR